MSGRITIHNYEAWMLDHIEGRLDASQTAQLRAFARAHPDLEIDLDNPADLPYLEAPETTYAGKTALHRHAGEVPHEDVIAFIEGLLSDDALLRFEMQLAGDPSLRALVEQYRRTVLQPDDSIRLEAAFALKKSGEETAWVTALEKFEASIDNAGPAAENFPGGAAPAVKNELRILHAIRLQPDLSIVFPDKSRLLKRSRIIALFTSASVLRVAAMIALVAGFAVLFNTPHNEPTKGLVIGGRENLLSPVRATVPHLQENKSRTDTSRLFAGTGKASQITRVRKPHQRTVAPVEPVVAFTGPDSIPNQNSQPGVSPVMAAAPATILVSDRLKNDTVQIGPVQYASAEDLIWIEEEPQQEVTRVTFFQKIASVAGHANKLGIKGIDGEPEGEAGFRIRLFGYTFERE